MPLTSALTAGKILKPRESCPTGCILMALGVPKGHDGLLPRAVQCQPCLHRTATERERTRELFTRSEHKSAVGLAAGLRVAFVFDLLGAGRKPGID